MEKNFIWKKNLYTVKLQAVFLARLETSFSMLFPYMYLVPNCERVCSPYWLKILPLVIENSVVNKHLVLRNKFLGQISHFTSKIYPVITNPGYKKNRNGGPELFVITKFHCIFFQTGVNPKQKISSLTTNLCQKLYVGASLQFRYDQNWSNLMLLKQF